jgi:uncharacterized protein (TIGR02231 family)
VDLKKELRRFSAGGAAVACVLVLAIGLLPAATLQASGARIVQVTTFPDRAEIVREVHVNVPAGASTVEFPGLPWHAEPDSLRASARGVPAVLGAVELKPAAQEPEEPPELIAARDEVRRLERALAGLEAQAETAKELREYIGALQATTAVRESERLGEGRADPASIQAVYDLVRSSLQGLGKEALERRDRRRELAEELKVARARLNAARPAGPIRTRIATVEVEAKQAGALTLQLEYLAPGASWRPAYRASLDAATGEVDLTSEAVVTQRTGEDWESVSLRLSTASPARGVKPPELPPWLLRPIELRVSGGFGKAKRAAPAGERMLDAAPEPEAFTGAVAAEWVEEEADRLQADIVRSAYNLAFEVPGRSDIMSDGTDHRVGLRQDTLGGTVEYRTVPSVNQAAFMVAKTKAPEGYPLLAGAVRVFAGGAYLGSFPVRETGPGAELTLPFGIDNRIRVERVPLPQARERTGIFGRERRIAYAFRTTVENLRDERVKVVLEERIPVSEDERIEVEQGRETTPGSTEVKDRPGILEWALEIEPGGKREVTLAYTVRFPKEMRIPGID